MTDMVNISVANAGITAILGYLVVFIGLILLMLVVMLMGKIMVAQNKKAAAKAAAEPAPAAQSAPVSAKPAPGTAGELQLYDTDPRDAAMVMGDSRRHPRQTAQRAALHIHQGGQGR